MEEMREREKEREKGRGRERVTWNNECVLKKRKKTRRKKLTES